MRRFIGCFLVVAACAIGLTGTAKATDTTRELINLLRVKGDITEEQYQALLSQIEEDEKAKAKTGAAKTWPEWLDRFSLFGDLRVRGEGFFQNDVTARDRFRIRARLGVTAKASDELEGTLRIVTGDPGDPISTNQTMSELFAKKPFSLDWAYLNVKPFSTFGWERPYLTIVAGKMPLNGIMILAGNKEKKIADRKFDPAWRPAAIMGSELVFDDDLAPEGFSQHVAAVEATSGLVRKLGITTNQWSVKELSSGADAWVFSGQGVADLAVTSGIKLTFGLADYYVSGANRIATEANTSSSIFITNDVVLKDGTKAGGTQVKPKAENPIARFTGGFNMINPSLQLGIDTGMPSWPVAVMADYVVNTEANGDDDSGWAFGAGIGQTKEAGDFAFSAAYEYLETNAVVSAWSGSDMGKGGTNVKGPYVKIEWMPLKGLNLSGKNYFVTLIDPPAGKANPTLNRLQVDAQYKF